LCSPSGLGEGVAGEVAVGAVCDDRFDDFLVVVAVAGHEHVVVGSADVVFAVGGALLVGQFAVGFVVNHFHGCLLWVDGSHCGRAPAGTLCGVGVPVLALDVDGVLNALSSASGRIPTAVHVDPGFATPMTNPAVVGSDVLLRLDPTRDAALLGAVEHLGVRVVWVTTWEVQANVSVGPLLGLGPRDVVAVHRWFSPGGSVYGDSPVAAKASALDECFPSVPVLWLDDDAYYVARSWARPPDRAVRSPAARVGLTAADREFVVRWCAERTGVPCPDPLGMLASAYPLDASPRPWREYTPEGFVVHSSPGV